MGGSSALCLAGTRHVPLKLAAQPQRFIQVLSKSVETLELSEQQAITIVENALFHNANKLYHLNLDKL